MKNLVISDHGYNCLSTPNRCFHREISLLAVLRIRENVNEAIRAREVRAVFPDGTVEVMPTPPLSGKLRTWVSI